MADTRLAQRARGKDPQTRAGRGRNPLLSPAMRPPRTLAAGTVSPRLSVAHRSVHDHARRLLTLETPPKSVLNYRVAYAIRLGRKTATIVHQQMPPRSGGFESHPQRHGPKSTGGELRGIPPVTDIGVSRRRCPTTAARSITPEPGARIDHVACGADEPKRIRALPSTTLSGSARAVFHCPTVARDGRVRNSLRSAAASRPAVRSCRKGDADPAADRVQADFQRLFGCHPRRIQAALQPHAVNNRIDPQRELLRGIRR